ncbi:MAG: divergent polysaccharide deacetylase family protein [Gammaproteobacteria bacterium]
MISGRVIYRPLVAVLLALLVSAAVAEPRIAIIIDDLGNLRSAGDRITALDGPVALAILPHTPAAAYIAGIAHDAGKEVLLHLPLQPIEGAMPMGIGKINLDNTRDELNRILAANLASVPYVTGVNTHMGSLLTQHPGHMAWLMGELERNGNLFFVDSRTTPASVALRVALEYGVPATSRDVFLDDDLDPRRVAEQFALLKNRARAQGSAVAIGHPYPVTLALLERELPRLAAEGIELVAVRELIGDQLVLAAQ